MIFLYIIIIILILLTALSLLRVRLRFRWNEGNRVISVGLGQSGPEYNFISKTTTVKMFGQKVKTLKDTEEKREKKKRTEKKIPEKAEKKKKKIEYGKIISLIPETGKALWWYSRSILKAVIVEELEGEINGGFDEVDLTGMVYGYYQAATGAIPALGGRFRFIPDWEGASFKSSFQASIAIPLYKIVFKSVGLIFRLPLREIIKLAIGTKKGVIDG